MHLFSQILQVAALVFFVIAAVGMATGRYNLIAAGLACAVLAELIARGGV